MDSTESNMSQESQTPPPEGGTGEERSTENIQEQSISKTQSKSCSDLKSPLIMIAVDDSSVAEAAFDWYFEHAHTRGYQVLVVHVIDIESSHFLNTSFTSAEMMEQEINTLKSRGIGVEKKYQNKMRILRLDGTFQLLQGKAGEAIVQYATQMNAILVVMGTRGFGGLRSSFLGGVSKYVLHHAHCAVATLSKRQLPVKPHQRKRLITV